MAAALCAAQLVVKKPLLGLCPFSKKKKKKIAHLNTYSTSRMRTLQRTTDTFHATYIHTLYTLTMLCVQSIVFFIHTRHVAPADTYKPLFMLYRTTTPQHLNLNKHIIIKHAISPGILYDTKYIIYTHTYTAHNLYKVIH